MSKFEIFGLNRIIFAQNVTLKEPLLHTTVNKGRPRITDLSI
jgi:hypothetical protein